LPTMPSHSGELRLAFTLSAVIALRMLGLFLILPVFMVLAAAVPGFTPQLGGLAVGIYGLMQALLQQPFGWLSDRWGRRPVLFLGMGLFALGGVLAAQADSMVGLVLGRTVQGCGAVAGVAMAFAADYTRPEKRPLTMAIIGMGIGGSFLLSMLASVPLANLLGLRGLLALTALLGVLGMMLVLTTPRADARTAVVEAHAAEHMKPLWLLALSVFLLHTVMTLLFVVLPGLLVKRHTFALAEHWKLYFPAMVLSVLLMLPVLRWMGTRKAEGVILPWAFGILGIALILLAQGFNMASMVSLMVAYFLAFNLLEAAMPALVARVAGSRDRGRRMGLYSTFQFLGAFCGGVGGGFLLAYFGGSFALAIAGWLCLAWGASALWFMPRFFLTSQPDRL
jgi:MFS family permease